MPQVPGVTTYLHGALIGMEVRINTSAWPGYTEAITANENALIASNLSIRVECAYCRPHGVTRCVSVHACSSEKSTLTSGLG